MHEKLNSSTTRAILHALPTALLALDSTDTIILANASASRLLHTSRENLEGGPLARFVAPHTHISSTSQPITFLSANGPIELTGIAKEIIAEDSVIRVILIKPISVRHDQTITQYVTGLSGSLTDPFIYVCKALIQLGITQHACVRSTTSTECEVLASTTDKPEIFSHTPTIARTISHDEVTHVELVIIPDSSHGLKTDDLAVIDMFISLLHLRVDNQEVASDASGSETALALALKAGDMGMCFFDTSRGDCYLSDHLATWCGINIDTFSGTIEEWLATFREDDRIRITTLFSELKEHKKFKTVVHVQTLEQEIRLELFGRPLHEHGMSEWVTIVRPYRDEQEVEAAWQTRIAMEESARIEAETQAENFEQTLVETLLPTTSDVSLNHSRQDAGTWHIVRQLDSHTSIYAVGAIVSENRAQAVIGATLTATIADVLASQAIDVENFVELVRDHARARDIETSIAAVRVVNGNLHAATHGGASVYISGRSFVGTESIQATTALSLSTHSQATPETIDVASNGRPWRIMSTVIEVISVIDVEETEDVVELALEEALDQDRSELPDSYSRYIDTAEDEDPEDTAPITEYTHVGSAIKHDNVSPFRSGSISPS